MSINRIITIKLSGTQEADVEEAFDEAVDRLKNGCTSGADSDLNSSFSFENDLAEQSSFVKMESRMEELQLALTEANKAQDKAQAELHAATILIDDLDQYLRDIKNESLDGSEPELVGLLVKSSSWLISQQAEVEPTGPSM